MTPDYTDRAPVRGRVRCARLWPVRSQMWLRRRRCLRSAHQSRRVLGIASRECTMQEMQLVVSLDSENASWLREHMANGNLPNLAALARLGASVDVTAATLAGTAYPTLYTGQRPADLGFYFPLQWEPEDQSVIPWDLLPAPDRLFERIDNAGKRIVVLDPPESQPCQLSNGFCASGIQFRARVLLQSWSSGAALPSEAVRRLGPGPRADEIFGKFTPADLRYLRSALLQAPARLATVAREFLKQDPPDCMWVTCCGLHVAGHQFFHLPLIRDSGQRAQLEGTRLQLARGYDQMIGSLLEMLPRGSRVFVFYAKGMGRVTDWSDLLEEMLRRVLRQKKGGQPISLLRRFLPRSIRRWGARSISDQNVLKTMARLSTPRAVWGETRAFCLPTDHLGFIRFNVAGRERHGLIKESESQELREEISAGLQTFTSLDGHPCMESVLSPQDLFGEGRNIHRFPDLIVTWKQRQGESTQGVTSVQFGNIRRSADIVGRSGNHCPGAFAILADGNRPNARLNENMQIEDIPATLMDGLDLPAGDLPGKSFWK